MTKSDDAKRHGLMPSDLEGTNTFTPSELYWSDEVHATTKSLRRGRHLELLVFELLACMEELWDSQALHGTESYEKARLLYKALAHNRRPDGSRY